MREHALHLVTTGKQELGQVVAMLAGCPAGFVDVLHIREKHRSARDHLAWYEALAAALPQTAVYINDRLDAAAAVRAPGVQLGYGSLPPKLARAVVPAGTAIGCSVHSREEAKQAADAGADYVLYGHIYASGSKIGVAPRGTESLAEVVAAAPVPVIAIGGIEPHRVDDVLATGCAGVAVMSSVFAHERPVEQIRRFREALDACKHSPRWRRR